VIDDFVAVCHIDFLVAISARPIEWC
jgi:hypothetical protein